MKFRYRIARLRLPLKVKLLLAAALLMAGLFFAYNLVQYVVLKEWMLNLEKTSIQHMMVELQDHFANSELNEDPDLLDRHKRFIESINQNNQLVRVLDSAAKPLLVVADSVPEEWVPPAAAVRQQLTSVTYGRQRLLVLRSPLDTPRFHGTIEIVNNLESFGKLHNAVLTVMLIGGGVALGISGLGGWLVARQLLRPVQSLADAMRRAKENGLQERVGHVSDGDELSQLASLYNGLMDQVEGSFRQQRQFVEDASHELKTPIAIMEGHLSMLQRWGKSDPSILEESLQTSLGQLARLKGIMQELLDLTRAETVKPLCDVQPLRIYDAVFNTVESLKALYPDFSFEADLTGLIGAEVRIEQRHLEQILLIVLDNAVKYSAERKRIAVTGGTLAGKAEIAIQDQGIGIEAEHIPHLFDRFYRVDKARTRERGGTGLGLSIAKRLVENYAGTIRIASKPGDGTTVRITLPAAAGR
ncbi:hypothetical protein SD70_11535 [Gordoniibacillus kamchatkensis]|uniref:Signal transduction histidine-protein kinase ArlS n=1 Tax=Gordoniibacillus kamchatkensis TaxID=1590651 RepID=A0ABR5AI57_9BACL|nr:HAMP domain-containing histidine kinase [Paenibacillus sp. VKM B-2647]KIL40712.1 hypothetical protein SD70_11535 [Paenibacillus sp. VKM B-2647]